MFKFEIGEDCYIYFWDDYEPCKILDRKEEFSMNYYLTDIHPNWQKEVFLRKKDEKINNILSNSTSKL